MENKTSIITEVESYNTNEIADAQKALKKIHNLLYDKSYERAFKLIDEGIEKYEEYPYILVNFEIKKIIALLRVKNFKGLDENIRLLQEKYSDNREISAMLESLMQEFYLGTKRFDVVIKSVEDLMQRYPENSGLFEVQRLDAYMQSGREELVLSNSAELARKYPERETTFMILKLKTLMKLGRYEEIYNLNPEDINLRARRNDVIRFGRLKVEALIRDGKYEEAINEMNSLRLVYRVKQSYFKEQIDLMEKDKVIEDEQSLKNIITLSQIIEMDESDFLDYAKGLSIKQFTFLQVARYKHERRHKIALGTIEEYKRRSKEDGDLYFVKKLKELAVIKKKSFDFMKWYDLSNRLSIFTDVDKEDKEKQEKKENQGKQEEQEKTSEIEPEV